MDIKKTLVSLRKDVDKRLNIYLEKKISKARKISPLAEKMASEIKRFVINNGKRIRPILVYYGYLAGGGKNKKAILDASIFAELIHDYFLIHDDIIDKDDLRRGQNSFHRQYEIFYKKEPAAKHLGISAAILAGDLLAVFGYDVLARAKFDTGVKNKAIDELNKVVADVIAGQTLDVFLGRERYLEEKEISKIQEYKTSRYTIEGPLKIGAILAGAGQKTLTQISAYALPIGIAFQIYDDILGMFGDSKKTGKPSGADLREGKQTLLILKARAMANQKQKKIIDRALGNPLLGEDELNEVRKIIMESGSLQYSKELARQFVNKADSILKKSFFPEETKLFLAGVGRYIIDREK